jgi:hypothetical protein
MKPKLEYKPGDVIWINYDQYPPYKGLAIIVGYTTHKPYFDDQDIELQYYKLTWPGLKSSIRYVHLPMHKHYLFCDIK